MNNVSSFCITAIAGTDISQNFFLLDKIIINSNQKDFTAQAFTHPLSISGSII